MVKIKDFTLASKNLGGGARALPCGVPYSTPAHVYKVNNQNSINLSKTSIRTAVYVQPFR